MWKEVKFYNDYFKIVHKAAYNVKHGKGLKTLTSKQMLERLPILFAHVKAGNTYIYTSYILCIEQKKLLKKYITI